MENLDKIAYELTHQFLSLEDKRIIEGRIKRVKDGYFLEFDGNSSVVFRSRKYPESKKYSKRIVVTRRRDFHGIKDSRMVGLFGYNTVSREKLNSLCYEEMVNYIKQNCRLNGKGRVYHIDSARIE